MSERQTLLLTDSTNNFSESEPNSQYDSLFGEGPTLGSDLKAVNLFKSPGRTPLMINIPII